MENKTRMSKEECAVFSETGFKNSCPIVLTGDNSFLAGSEVNYCKWMRVSVKTSELQTASFGLYPYLLWGARKEKRKLGSWNGPRNLPW